MCSTYIFKSNRRALTETEKSVLERGLRFCLPPKDVDKYDVKCSFELLYRDLIKLYLPLTDENHDLLLVFYMAFLKFIRLVVLSALLFHRLTPITTILLLTLFLNFSQSRPTITLSKTLSASRIGLKSTSIRME